MGVAREPQTAIRSPRSGRDCYEPPGKIGSERLSRALNSEVRSHPYRIADRGPRIAIS
jgi:hypothetical protein